MQVAITTRRGSLSEKTRQYIIEKSEKLLTYFERVTAIQVTVDFENGRTKIELLVDAEHKHNFVAHHEGDDVPSTFDQTLHKMEQQIRRYKQKVQDHRRDVPLNKLGESEESPETPGEEQDEVP